MAGGKFARSRSGKRQDQELEEAFLQVTGQTAPDDSLYPDPDEEESYPSNPTIARNKRIVAIALCAVAIVLLAAIGIGVAFLLGGSEADDGLILNNVTVVGVNIGGMTPEDAATALHRATDLTYSVEDMVIQLPDTTIRLSPADTGAKLNVEAVVEAAYNYGRTGTEAEQQQAKAQSLVSAHTIAVLPYLELDVNYIRQVLDEYGALYNSTFTPSTYEFEGEKPELEGKYFDEDAPCQTLVLTLGTPGKYIDIEKLYTNVLDAYSFNTFLVTAREASPEEMPVFPDLEEIFEKYCSEATDASLDPETFEVVYEIYGYTFDLESAKELLEDGEYGQTLRISMEYLAPEVLGEELAEKLFRDVLGSCETPHTMDTNRNTNLRLACEAINGMILNPGDTFDYNEALGERTVGAGYKPAGAYANGVSVSEVGGGICQVSSTLYYAALLSDLEIVTRQAHSYASGYIDLGMDATVSWGGPHFRFRNNTDYPIRIEAEVSDGYVRVKLIGTDERDYYIKMEYKITETDPYAIIEREYEPGNGYADGDVIQQGVSGHTVNTYRCKYSKETGELISREFEATSVYKKKDQIVASVKPAETTPPETGDSSDPPTEASSGDTP